MARAIQGGRFALVLACLSPSACAPNPTPAPLVLRGVDLSSPVHGLYNEPFWNIELTGAQIIFYGVDLPRTVAPQPRPVMSPERAVYETVTIEGDALRVTLEAVDGCSDSMSEDSYPLAVIVELGDAKFEGCATGNFTDAIIVG